MRSRSIRFRITVVATAAVAAVLILAGAALVIFQRQALTSSVDQALAVRADDVAALLGSEPPLPVELAGGAEEGFTQVVAPDGEILATTANLAGVSALQLVGADETGDVYRTATVVAVDDDSFRVLSRRVPGIGTIHVGTTFDIVGEAAGALTTALFVMVPIVVVALGVLVWWLVGRTLEPVEQIRVEVAGISSTDLDHRVPEPGTGDEIDRLAETMNEMLARLETAADRQQRFVTDASHELRSPLTRLRSEIEVELRRTADDRWRAALESLLADVVGMQEVAEDLLYLARLDEVHVEVAVRRLDFDDVVIAEAKRLLAEGGVDVDYSAVSGALVMGNAGQLSRSVRNLLDNAERHAGDLVSLSLQEVGSEAVLTVADDGPGIAREDADRIFERFGRLDEARSSDTGGSGLGLAIARDIVARHGGTLQVVGIDVPGAALELRLPLAD
jgi:signal transduction histidine kinase